MNVLEKIEAAVVKYHYVGERKQRIINSTKHSDCYRHLMMEEIQMRKRVIVDEECYLTSQGRYVDRKEARNIAYTAKQLPKHYPHDILYADDIIY